MNCLQNEESVFRKLLPSLVLIVFSFGGAGIFQLIEGGVNCRWDFNSCLWFVNTVVTTIGYGNVAPCTPNGRIFTIIYVIFSLPLTLVAFANIGQLIVRGLSYMQSLISKQIDQKKAKKRRGKSIIGKPFSLIAAVCVTVVTILLAAVYFFLITQNAAAHPSIWYFFDSLYFVFISITTIGFGDFYPKNFELTAAHFAVIILTQSMFSMCTNLVLEHIAYQFSQMKYAIYDNYKSSLGGNAEMDVKMLKRMVNSTLKGRLLYLFGSKVSKEDLQITFDKLAKYRSASCGPDPEWTDKETQHCPKAVPKFEKICQTAKTFNIES